MSQPPDDLPPLAALKRRIERSRRSAEGKEQGDATPQVGNDSRTSYGYLADLCSGFGVGAGLGYGLDRAFDTLPVFLVLGLLLGSASSFLLMYKASRR